MKLRSLISLCAVALFSVAAMAQIAGKVHGRVTDPTGVTKTVGTIGLSTDQGHTFKYSFPVGATGDYTGTGIAPGTYSVVYKMPDTAEGKFVDMIDNVKIIADQDTLQDVDMSRKEYIDKMTPDQRKQVEDFKKKNAEIMKTNSVIKTLNADLNTARQDNKDKKYDEAEALMLKDTVLRPDGVLLWYELGNAQLGEKKWDDAIASYKKVLDLDVASKKPNIELEGGAHAGLGEVYARDGKADDVATAETEYDSASKVNPTKAGFYYSNETVVFQNTGNGEAQAAAADKAITADPKNPLPYYLKGQALAAKITIDAKSGAYILPPGMVDAYKTYLQLAPTGQFVAEVNAVLAETTKTVQTTFKATKKK
jgi:tetratricopeptide (TPR) repeat protein